MTAVENEKTQHMMAMAALCATGWRSREGGFVLLGYYR
eukprot:COSAG02_NODE_630_length_19310_cov_19.127271_10_plen_38_part_00